MNILTNINNEFESNQQNQIQIRSASSNESGSDSDPRKNSKIRVRSHLCFQLHFKTMLFQIIINSTLMISAKLFEKLAKAVKQNF